MSQKSAEKFTPSHRKKKKMAKRHTKYETNEQLLDIDEIIDTKSTENYDSNKNYGELVDVLSRERPTYVINPMEPFEYNKMQDWVVHSNVLTGGISSIDESRRMMEKRYLDSMNKDVILTRPGGYNNPEYANQYRQNPYRRI